MHLLNIFYPILYLHNEWIISLFLKLKYTHTYIHTYIHITKHMYIIKGSRIIDFIFIVISTMFRPICPPVFFRPLSKNGNYVELRTTSFIESLGVTCSDSINHKWVQMLRTPILLLACSQDWTCKFLMIAPLKVI